MLTPMPTAMAAIISVVMMGLRRMLRSASLMLYLNMSSLDAGYPNGVAVS